MLLKIIFFFIFAYVKTIHNRTYHCVDLISDMVVDGNVGTLVDRVDIHDNMDGRKGPDSRIAHGEDIHGFRNVSDHT